MTIFDQAVSSKLGDCVSPCLEKFKEIMEATKDTETGGGKLLASFDGVLQKAFLMSTATSQGTKVRESLELLKHIGTLRVHSLDGERSMEAKYKAIQAWRQLQAVTKVKEVLSELQTISSFSAEGFDLVEKAAESMAKDSESAGAYPEEIRVDFKKSLENVIAEMPEVELAPQVEKISTHAEISQSFLANNFGIKKTADVSQATCKLKAIMGDVNSAAEKMDYKEQDVLMDLSSYEVKYRSALRFLCVGNILFCLGSKTVKRAIENGGRPTNAAMQAFKEALAAAADNAVEVPPGLQALVTDLKAHA
eukprot:s728_g39.t1